MASRFRMIRDADHLALTRQIANAKVSVWLATANLKATMIEAPIGTRARARGRYVSFFETLTDLVARGVEVRLLHAGEPSRPLKGLVSLGAKAVPMKRCPRVHLKMIAIDGGSLYLGSANLTGAGIGAKGENRRNFEMGIVTDDESMLDAAQAHFDRIWRGAECKGCELRKLCPRPLDLPPKSTSRGRSQPACRSPRGPR